MSDRLLNLNEASKYLGIAKPTIYLYARTGKIPALKVGYLWKFDKDDLKNHLKKQMKSLCREEEQNKRMGVSIWKI